MRHKIALTYLGAVIGFLILLLLHYSVWLEMRINTSLILPFLTLAGFAVSLKWQPRVSLLTAGTLQLLVLFLLIWKYGLDTEMLSVMPAMLLREGFYLNFFDLQKANIALTILIVLGNLAVLTSMPRQLSYRN